MSSPITRRVQNALHMKSALKQTEEENNPNVTTEDLGTVGNTESGTIQKGTRTTETSETYVPGQDLKRLSYDEAWEQDLEGIQSMYPNKEAYIADREGQRKVDPEGFEKDLVEKTGVSGGPGTVTTPGTTTIEENIVDNYEDIPSEYRRLTQLDAGKNYRGLKKAMKSEMKLRKKLGQYKGKGMSRKEKLASTDIGKQIADMNFEVAGNPFQDRAGTMHKKTFTNINDDSYNVPNLNTKNSSNKMKEDKKSDYSPFKMGGYGHKRDSAIKMDDLSGDGKVTKKDVLIGRGVIDKDGSPLKQKGIKGYLKKKISEFIGFSKSTPTPKTKTKVEPKVKNEGFKPGDEVDLGGSNTNKTSKINKDNKIKGDGELSVNKRQRVETDAEYKARVNKNKTNVNKNNKTPNNTKTPDTKGRAWYNKKRYMIPGAAGAGYMASNMMQPSIPENVNITPSLTIPGGGGTSTSPSTTTPKTTPPANVEKRTSRKITFNNVENPQYSSSPKRGPQAGPGDKVSTSNNRQAQRIQNRDQRASNRQKRRTENLAERQKRRSMRRANPTIVGGAMRNTFGGKTYDTQINNMRKKSPNKMGSGFKMKGYNK